MDMDTDRRREAKKIDGTENLSKNEENQNGAEDELFFFLSVSPWHTHLTSRSVKRTFEIIKIKKTFFF